MMMLSAYAATALANDIEAVASRDTGVSTPSTAAPPCNWWVDRERCPEEVEGLPPEASRNGTVITVDTSRNMAYIFVNGELKAKGRAATGMDQWLTHKGRRWLFRTPRGRMEVLRKIVDPIWTKPDWAFVEEGKRIPSPDSPLRKQRGKMGKYALDLGDGILIHGTDDPSSLGKKASHGCVRLGATLMKKAYQLSERGTEVWVF
jgi:L,D-transpeptidase YbiS